MQTQPDNLTKFLAAWGAGLATFGLGWTLYRDLLDRAKLQISAKVRRIAHGIDGKYFAVAPDLPVQATEKLFVVMTVVNVGRRPVMWQGWGGKYYKREPEGTAIFIVGQNLPKMLQEGESHSEMTELNDDLKPANDNVKKLYVWDPAGKEWSLSKRQLRNLRQEARKAKGLPLKEDTDHEGVSMTVKNVFQFVPIALASFILGAGAAFLVLTHSNVPKGWLPLSTNDGGYSVETKVLKPDMPFPKISKPEGKAKFLERDNGVELGYVIKVSADKLYVSTLPEKYRRTSKLDNGIVISPPDQVVYFGHFEFTFEDADGFALTTLSGGQENVFTGQDNNLRGIANGTVPTSITKRTKKILVRLVIEDCNPCNSN